MSQLKELKKSFPTGLRNYGQILFKSKALDWATDDGRVVTCYVNDGDDYLVQLALDNNCVYGFCGCDSFEMEGLCSHLWTVLLAAEELGTLFEKGGTPPLFFAPEEDAKLFAQKFLKKKPKAKTNTKTVQKEKAASTPKPQKEKAPAGSAWKATLQSIQKIRPLSATERAQIWPKNQQLLYILNLHHMKQADNHNQWVVQLAVRSHKPDGSWSTIKSKALDCTRAGLLPDPDDREIISMLTGAIRETQDTQHHWDEKASSLFRLTKGLAEPILQRICQTGRAYTSEKREGFKNITPLSWDGGRPWEFVLKGTLTPSKKSVALEGTFRRKDTSIDLRKPKVVQRDGFILIGEKLSRLRSTEAIQWYERLKTSSALTVPLEQKKEFLHELYEHPTLPKLDFPPEFQVEQVLASPRSRLLMNEPEGHRKSAKILIGQLSFRYASEIVEAHAARNYLFLDDGERLCERDFDAEQSFREQLFDLGFTLIRDQESEQEVFRIALHKFQEATAILLSKGWHVEAYDKPYRQANDMDFTITSGMDWFDLEGSVSFDGVDVGLPELLTALKKGSRVVSLGDGSFGMLPETWLGKYGLLAGLGDIKKDTVRFQKSQAPLLDALLADAPGLKLDSTFTEIRSRIRNFEGVKSKDAPSGFIGTLRPYQQTALGWFEFLDQFGFGGCLADDMGLGKTVQVLALLEERRALRESDSTDHGIPRPSLIVVPKSIVFNWQREAERFTPKLNVLNHTGGQRKTPGEHFNAYDIILTTYGTLRNDIETLQLISFDYAILDESQAIKNQTSEAAKAVRLLKRDHALTMTGTPIENHLGELWSQFEFLNPGMLGRASIFKKLIPEGSNQSEGNPELLARSLRPFILRRTKKQVAPELPEKLEQTLYCDLPESQQRQYNELKTFYQQSLLKRVQADGISRSKIQILEALLRLRQAACHPGLLDEQKQSESSGKLDILIPRLIETVQEGHKALVFSQFTSFLRLVRTQLDPHHISYEYLDGKTRNRQERVDRFQTDPDCKLFLISLKAGGVGLNLTAAQSVFLLDPWWNPAVEAQAIDRSHRIGQTQKVFAFRLIARGTVEEKVLELQKKKKKLAESIINADNSLIRTLKREDLELLLS